MGGNINKIPPPLPINTVVLDQILVDHINEQLINYAGKWEDGRPNFRVVWAPDQTGKRWVTHTGQGIELLHPVVKETRKYAYLNDVYVLERLVPVVGETDLTTKTSYEPCRVFNDKWGRFLPPRMDFCVFVIDTLAYNAGKKGALAKYSDPAKEQGYFESQVEKTEHELFDNETEIGDALAHGAGIVSAGTTQGPITKYQNSQNKE